MDGVGGREENENGGWKRKENIFFPPSCPFVVQFGSIFVSWSVSLFKSLVS
jgi:hypothetical protein